MMARVFMVSIGDELLDGRTADGNARTLGAWLRRRGHRLVGSLSASDSIEAIVDALSVARARSEVVVTSGGLGPTLDDLTRDALAQAAAVPLAHDAASESKLRRWFAARGREMAEVNLRQTWFPAGARVIPNATGTADAFVTLVESVPVLSLPGVPREFFALLDAGLAELLPTAAPRWYSTRYSLGLGESEVARRMESLVRPPGVHVTWCAKFPLIEVELSAAAEDASAGEAYADAVWALLDRWLLPAGASTPEQALVAALTRDGSTVAVAESCTGGGMLSALTDVPGASSVVGWGAVTYSNEAKSGFCGVPAELVAAHGAVSAQVAAAMAEGIRRRGGATWGLSATGIAGPDGGSVAKPVGTVFVGIAGADGTRVLSLSLGATRTRREVRVLTAALALRALERAAAGRLEDLGAAAGVLDTDCYPGAA
jgi:nicotinamide-nucleotide amidase